MFDMKIRLTKEGLKARIYEEVQKALSEGLENDEDGVSSAFILQPQYTNFIKTACHIIAWKGLDFDLNIRGNEYRIAKQLVDSYIAAKQEAMKSSDPKGNVARVKEEWRTKKGCEGLVDTEKEAFEKFTQFKENGYRFIKRFLGSKSNSSKQMERQAGLALFGEKTDLREFNVMHGAVFCVRDFFKWVEAGMPDFEQTKAGKMKKGDSPLRQAGITGIMTNKDELGKENLNGQNEGSELWNNVKAVLDNYETDSVGFAKAIVGGSIRDNQEVFQEVMLYIAEYKKFIKGSKQNSDAFRAQAYDALDKLVEKIKELHAEPAISQFMPRGEQPAGLNEMEEERVPGESPLHNEGKAKLVENTRKIKMLALESYDLADTIDDRKFKALYGKIVEAILKAESRQATV